MPFITISLNIVARVPIVPRAEAERSIAEEVISQAFLGFPDPYGGDGIFFIHDGEVVPFEVEDISLKVLADGSA